MTNTSNDKMLVYFEVDIQNFPEVVIYPDTDKVGIFNDEHTKSFFNRSTNVSYYEGE